MWGWIACGETICGTAFFDGYTRDTEWWIVTGLTGANAFTITGKASFDLQLLFITDTGNDCVGYTYLIATAPACVTATIVTSGLPNDTYYVWVGPQFTSTFACAEGDPQYWVHLDCEPVAGGACCTCGICYDGYTLDACAAINGTYQGDGTLCANIVCPPALQGDNCEYPIVVTNLPFTGSDVPCYYPDTCWCSSDYAPRTCGYDAGAPDFVLRYMPDDPNITAVNISLCGSAYDAMLWVYAGDCSGTEIACNDDFCGLQSEIDHLAVTTGTPYYIVVGGYGNSCGYFAITITEDVPCVLTCPPGATDEGEPCGADTNSGCNSSPPIFGSISCGETTCGTSYFDGYTHDTDWFIVQGLTGANIFTVTAEASFDLQLLFMQDTGNDCVGYSYYVATSPACVPASIVTAGLPMDTYYVWVGPQFTSTFACTEGDPQYWVHLDCQSVPSGACCRHSLCWDGYTEDACLAFGGHYQGDNVPCYEAFRTLQPDGENCADPRIIPAVPYTDSDNTCVYALDCPASCGANNAPDVIYRWTPAEDGLATVSLCGSSFDTVIHVQTPCCGDDIVCNDDYEPCGLQSQVSWDASAGVDYYIIVSGFSTACGSYVLDLSAAPPPIGACCVNSTCIGNVEAPACSNQGGTWFPGEDCAVFTCPTENLIINGDFEQGNLGFSTDYIYSHGDIWEIGTYDVLHDVSEAHPLAELHHDHTTGNGLLLAANGALPNLPIVWSQTVTVTPGMRYKFLAWAANWARGSGGHMAPLEFRVNGIPVASWMSTVVGEWFPVWANWDAGDAAAAEITIVDLSEEWDGNDPALDDLWLVPLGGMNCDGRVDFDTLDVTEMAPEPLPPAQ